MVEKLEQKSILLVENNRPMFQFMQALFKVEGYQVTGFTNALLAHGYFVENRSKVDLVSLDVMTEGMDGVEFVRRVKEIDPSMPIVIVSACTDREDVTKLVLESEQEGRKPIRCLPEPFLYLDLLEIVKKELYPDGLIGEKPGMPGVPAESVKTEKGMIVSADIKCYYCDYVSGTITGDPSEPIRASSFRPSDPSWTPKPGDKLRCRKCGGPVYLDEVRRLRGVELEEARKMLSDQENPPESH